MYAPRGLILALYASANPTAREAADTILMLQSLVAELQARVEVLEAEVTEHRSGQQVLEVGEEWR
jgi:hypothetical protein